MQAIILAAGMGRRLKELTKDQTKCMVEVNGVSLIERLLGQLDSLHLSRVVMVVGYKAEKKGNTLVMQLGYSHPIEMGDPEGITTECPSATEITVKGASKAQVGNYAAVIRAWRAPEPYKGKGIHYVGEYIRRKEGKTGK